MRWTIHKFGGTSLGDADRLMHVAELVAGRDDAAQGIVVSAMAGVTDRLIGLAQDAARDQDDWFGQLTALRRHHLDTAAALTESDTALRDALSRRFERLGQLLESLALMGTAPLEAVELIAGLGEICTAELLAARLQASGHQALVIDAREVLRVRPTAMMAAVDWSASKRLLDRWTARHPASRYVITGFVCRHSDGRISVLGRNGSDYSATIFARLFEADAVHIWTDVDGLLSADPAAVPQAQVLGHLSYREAFELAYFGARVIHPQALSPALEAHIPVFVRNTFKPELAGTRIDAGGHPHPPVKGISGVDQRALITIEGTGMIGVPGTAERVFSALHRADISVSMISQGSSEHSICVVVDSSERARAVEVLREAFEREIRHGLIQRVFDLPDIRVLAIVGEGMAGTPGIAARLFLALARAGVNVRAIAQGASERNISVAIDEDDAARAIKAVHAGFYLSDQTVSVGLIGPGQVGRALLAQLMAARERLLGERGIDLRLRAVAGSRLMRLSAAGIDDIDPQQPLGDSPEPATLDALAAHIADGELPHGILIDCSASETPPEHYADWLARGIHVITPNKHAGSGPLERYREIRDAAARSGARWRYEATVGAGLPVIQTLCDLIDTGDRIKRIDGIFSGTLAWLFNRFEPGTPFSALVAEARDAGYTEPDPRDDLSGTDVARKLVILAREMGMEISLDDVSIESLAPNALQDCDIDAFMAGLAAYDPAMDKRLEQARRAGRVLRFVASLDAAGQAKVRLESLPGDHPFAHLALTDNVVAFTTERYRDNPLIVQGPGAGPAVTAGGVFADLLRVVEGLGGRP